MIDESNTFSGDYKLLTAEGNLGFYTRCEITTIFAHDRRNKKNINLYTIVVFEEADLPDNKELFITDGLKSINDNYSFGIIKYYKTMDNVNKQFLNLLKNNEWQHNGEELKIPAFKVIPKQFIRSDGSKPVPLNSVLKNNFYNGSYLLEFFAEDKGQIEDIFKTEEEFKKTFNAIRDLLPIDLLFIQDRIGNIIFQFPVTILTTNIKGMENWEGINLKLAWHPKLENIPDYTITSISNFDQAMIGFDNINKISQNYNQLKTGNSSSLSDIIIYNPENNLVVGYLSSSFMKNINFTTELSGQHSEPRTINKFNSEGQLQEVDKIKLSSVDFDSSHHSSKDYYTHIRTRKYENEKRRLEKELALVQYGQSNRNHREQALRDIRALINRHGRFGVYLWDPFLNHEDIIETLYYSKYSNIPLRAINSMNKNTKIHHSESYNLADDKLKYEEWLTKERESFRMSSNHLGINLEFRCQHHQYGWSFHDRFIIFPSPERPLAWSLGTSINGLGKRHHILQKVGNAQIILDAFNELWSELNNPDCLVWCSDNAE